MIVIKPTGGLCNRLRMIDSARLLSKLINKPLEIYWTLGPELNCSFDSLFELPSDYRVTESRSVPPPQSRLLNKACFIREYLRCRKAYQCVIFQSKMNRLLKRQFDFIRLAKYDSIYITCCNRFYRPQRRLQPIVPVAEIQNITAGFVRQFNDITIGVHIRRTDHHTVAAFSPEQGFVDIMNAELRQNPQTKFFLATDSPEILSRFTGLFGERVLWHPKTYDRGSPQGIQDALVDLLCLSQTKKIIGSGLSSFSETAAQLNDIPVTYINSD